jgi:hypothetical protein
VKFFPASKRNDRPGFLGRPDHAGQFFYFLLITTCFSFTIDNLIMLSQSKNQPEQFSNAYFQKMSM